MLLIGLKQEVQELKELVNTLSNLQSITPKSKEISEEINEEIKEKISKKVKEKIKEVLSEPINEEIKEEIKDDQRIELNTTELAERFKVSRGLINNNKKKFRENKITKEEYIEWTRTKDPDNKGWFFDESINYSV